MYQKHINIMGKPLRYFFRLADFTRSTRKLTSIESDLLKKTGSLFDVPFKFNGYGQFQSIRPKQVISEIQQMYQMVVAAEVRYVCEIGTYRGGTFYLWCKAARDDATLIALDLPGEDSLKQPFSPDRIKFYHYFAKSPNQQLHFIPADSHQRSTADYVAAILGPNKLDFLFIDGDHSHNGVRRDFELYKPLVRPGGMIAFHDILPRANLPEIEVYKLWGEIKPVYRHQEIVAQDGSHANLIGIGIIWLE